MTGLWNVVFACIWVCKVSAETRVGMGSGISREQIQRNLQNALSGLNLQGSMAARTNFASNCHESIPIYEQDIANEFPEGVVSATGPTKNIQCRCQPITVYEGNNEYKYEIMHCTIIVRPQSDQEKKVLKRLRYPPQVYDSISGQYYMPMDEQKRARLPFYLVHRGEEEYLEPKIMYTARHCRQNFMTTIDVKYNSEAPLQRSQSLNDLKGEPVGYISKHMCSFGSFVLNEDSAYLPPEREVQENEVVYVWNEDLWKLQPGLERDLYHIQPVICIPAQQLREHAKRAGDSTLKFKDPLGRLSWIDYHLEARSQRGFRRIFRDYTAFIVQSEETPNVACASSSETGPPGISSQAGSSSQAGTSGSSSQAGPSSNGVGISGSSSQAGPSSSSEFVPFQEAQIDIDTSPRPTDTYPSVSPSLPPFGLTNEGSSQQSEEEYVPFGRFALPDSPPAPSSPQSPSQRSDTSAGSSQMTPPGLHESRIPSFNTRSVQNSSPSRSASPLTPPGFNREELKALSDRSISDNSDPATPPGFREISSSQLDNHFNIILIIILTSIICTHFFYRSSHKDELQVTFFQVDSL